MLSALATSIPLWLPWWGHAPYITIWLPESNEASRTILSSHTNSYSTNISQWSISFKRFVAYRHLVGPEVHLISCEAGRRMRNDWSLVATAQLGISIFDTKKWVHEGAEHQQIRIIPQLLHSVPTLNIAVISKWTGFAWWLHIVTQIDPKRSACATSWETGTTQAKLLHW